MFRGGLQSITGIFFVKTVSVSVTLARVTLDSILPCDGFMADGTFLFPLQRPRSKRRSEGPVNFTVGEKRLLVEAFEPFFADGFARAFSFDRVGLL